MITGNADRFQDWLDRGGPNPDPHDEDGDDLQLDIYDLPPRQDEPESVGKTS